MAQQTLTHNFLLGVAKTLNSYNVDVFDDLHAEIGGCKDASLDLRRDLFAV